MKIINKKDDLKSTIPLMALFVSLNLIITVFATYLPVSGIVLILFLPLISTIYCLNTNKRYFPIYFLTSLCLSICFSVQDLTSTLLYLLPALIQGLFFAILINLKKDGILAYFISVLILFLTKFSIIPLIDFIYNINTIETILKILSLSTIENIDLFVYFGMFLLCTFEMFMVFIITKNELEKLGYKINLFSEVSLIFILVSTISSFMALVFSYMHFFKISYTFLALSLILSILITIQLIKKEVLIFSIVSGVSLVFTWIVFVSFLNKYGFLNSISILSTFDICMSFAGAIYLLCANFKKHKDE